MRAAVIVLGDLARSPRIVLHARALAGAGADVDLVGYADPAWSAGALDDRIHVWPLPTYAAAGPESMGALAYSLRAAMRGLSLLWQLARLLLWQLPRPDLVLVQNPPGVPTLAIVWLAGRLRTARVAIDWHNLTSAMLALRLGSRHPIVRVVAAYERFFGRRADLNFFVSSAMQALASEWGVRGTVFRDSPAATFAPLAPDDRRETRASILARVHEPQRSDVPIVVTATSWTADEDFELLFDALARYDARLAHAESDLHPARVLVLITGRGPLRSEFERRIAVTPFRCIGVHTLWLEADEYPRVIAAADLGVCLHRSASGVDLPMKILDMFGSGLPVCAYDYGPCLSELVIEGVNGLLFRTSEGLADQLCSTLAGGPTGHALLRRLRDGVTAHRMPEWEAAWAADVRPILMPGA